MAFYYVKSGGTATGDGGRATSKRTGAFGATSTYYDNIDDIFAGAVPTTAITSGDYVVCSHLHAKTYSASVSSFTDSKADGVSIVSVDDANQENYLRGAKETTQAGTDGSFIDATAGVELSIYGLDFAVDGTFALGLGIEQSFYIEDCVSELVSTGADIFRAFQDGTFAHFKKCEFIVNNTGQSFDVSNGAVINLITCSLSGSAATSFFTLKGVGGAVIVIDSLDASAMASSSKLIDISASSNDNCVATVTRCKLPTSGVVCNSTSVVPSLNVIGESLKIGTGGGWFQFNEVLGAGDNSIDTAIYRVAKYKVSGGEYSVDMTTNADASFHRFLRHKIATVYVDTDLYTTTVNFEVHFARNGSSVAYNSDKFWIDAAYNDGADDGLGSSVTTKPAVLATGVAPTTETALWTGLDGTNKQMSVSKSVTIGSSAGNIQSGMVDIYANFAVASDTVFVCKHVEVS